MTSPADAACLYCGAPMIFQENADVREYDFPVDAIVCCACGYQEVLGRADVQDDESSTEGENVIV